MKANVFAAFNEIEIADYMKAHARMDFESGAISHEQYEAAIEDIKVNHKNDWKNFKGALSAYERTESGFTVSVNAVDLLNGAFEKGFIDRNTAVYVMAIVTGKEDAEKYADAFIEWCNASIGAKVRKGIVYKSDKKTGAHGVAIRESLHYSSMKGKGARVMHGLIHDALLNASHKTDKVRMTANGWTLPDTMID